MNASKGILLNIVLVAIQVSAWHPAEWNSDIEENMLLFSNIPPDNVLAHKNPPPTLGFFSSFFSNMSREETDFLLGNEFPWKELFLLKNA